ncbi:hypothetical protein CEXT_694711 [Caerostris extrusa]|uniref:Uncharacterized protein n=1 Tax=Caerostris extrusa TaxID=172846 RepID=A0AAV4QCN9_CAEEX|nr:hypothetical protein CEXT_694711 [Caerostris extrusa]
MPFSSGKLTKTHNFRELSLIQHWSGVRCPFAKPITLANSRGLFSSLFPNSISSYRAVSGNLLHSSHFPSLFLTDTSLTRASVNSKPSSQILKGPPPPTDPLPAPRIEGMNFDLPNTLCRQSNAK